jgi:F420-non-reducing hydrogenase iron-sulfur subunit
MSSDAQPALATIPNKPIGTPGPSITVLICDNGAREGHPPSAVRPRPQALRFDWPFPVQEILIPCTGRIQPEHLLKAFENGSDLVCVIACQQGNCHSLEGNLRAKRRVEYVQEILREIGLDERRLMWFSLPGSAREDMAAGVGETPGAAKSASPSVIAADIARQVKDRLNSLAPNPFGQVPSLAEKPRRNG